MIAWALIFLALAGGAELEPCKASVFGGRSDKHRGGRSPCLSPPRRIRANDWGIAHRSLKCGTIVAVVHRKTRKVVITRVLDHGPYGAKYRGEWRIKKRRRDPGKWIGCADLTRPVARAIGHSGGKDSVIVIPLSR